MQARYAKLQHEYTSLITPCTPTMSFEMRATLFNQLDDVLKS